MCGAPVLLLQENFLRHIVLISPAPHLPWYALSTSPPLVTRGRYLTHPLLALLATVITPINWMLIRKAGNVQGM